MGESQRERLQSSVVARAQVGRGQRKVQVNQRGRLKPSQSAGRPGVQSTTSRPAWWADASTASTSHQSPAAPLCPGHPANISCFHGRCFEKGGHARALSVSSRCSRAVPLHPMQSAEPLNRGSTRRGASVEMMTVIASTLAGRIVGANIYFFIARRSARNRRLARALPAARRRFVVGIEL